MERTFDFITDTCCGMPQEYIEAHGVTVLPLGYTIAGETYGGIEGKQLPPRSSPSARRKRLSFQVTAEQAKPSVEASSGRAGHVDRHLFLRAFGDRLLVYDCGQRTDGKSIPRASFYRRFPRRLAWRRHALEYLVKKADAGASIEEVYAYGDWLRHRIAYLFTVDDLDCLRRGGRISGAVAVVEAPQIKPAPLTKRRCYRGIVDESARWRRWRTKRRNAPTSRPRSIYISRRLQKTP
ncbi:MAG: DegV family protein [Christensenellaceae bacterium]